VVHDGLVVADSTRALRILETSHPPAIYVPPADVRMELLSPVRDKRTFCEFKGDAVYFDVAGAEAAAWAYPHPAPAYVQLRDHVSFYPGRVEACFLDEERVQAQAGDFYGGWVTAESRGPFKGGAGTLGW